MKVRDIGPARLYLADWREVVPALEPVGVVVSDPPYGTGGWRRSEAGQGSNPAAGLVVEAWDNGAVDWIAACKPAPILTFWPPARMPQLMVALEAAGYTKYRMLYMRKADPKPQVQGRIAWSVEPIVCASEDGFQLYGGTDWITATTPRVGRDNEAVDHPYQKPLAVMNWLVAKVRGDGVVLDPFMGSGTTGVACVTQGRRFIGVERDPAYYELACQRIEDALRQGRLIA